MVFQKSGISVEHCGALCTKIGNCAGFAYVKDKKHCWLKDKLRLPATKNDNVLTYYKMQIGMLRLE